MRELERRFPNELLVVGAHAGKYRSERRARHLREAVLRLNVEHAVVNDRQLRLWRSYTVNAWPTLVFLSPNGRYMGAHAGEISAERLAPLIQALIDHFDARGEINRSPVGWLKPAREEERDRLLKYPAKVHVGGGKIWIADSGHHRIVEARLDESLRGAIITRLIGTGTPGCNDGVAAQATFASPRGLALAGNTLYVADTANHAIRAVDLVSASVRTVAGTGQQGYERRAAGAARSIPLSSPWDVLAYEGRLIIAMAGTHQIWGYNPQTDVIGPIIGTGEENIRDGASESALLAQPSGLTSDGQLIYFADAESNAIRVVQQREVRTLVGTGLFAFGDKDGIGDEVELQHPLGVAYEGGKLYVADSYNNRIKQIDPRTREARAWAGSGAAGSADGVGLQAQFFEPEGLCSDGAGHLFIADTNNHSIRVADTATAEVWTLDLRAATATAPGGPTR